MGKTPSNHGKPVTAAVVKQVKELAAGNTPTRVIGLKIGRTESSVYGIASNNNISLKPTNQSPYGTKGKK
jgi:tartrate dehydratase alpha subunit/fumarate hydratase class I-like protein